MTLLNYTDPIPLPAAVTSGTTVQSYVDPMGDVWVAKNGVASGAWRRARDVVAARVYRVTAATSVASTWSRLGFDSTTVGTDIFSLNSGGTFTCPVAGRYLCIAQTAWGSNAAAWRQIAAIYKNGAEVVRGFDGTVAINSNGTTQVHDVVLCAANDYLELYYYTGVAVAMQAVSGITPFFSVQYLGAP